jgi:tRNA(fMet)-specific endonuclease VapC
VRRFLLDTNAASDLLEKRGSVPQRARDARSVGGRIGIGIPVLAELFYGVEFSAKREQNLLRLQRVRAGLTVWPFDERAAATFGRLRAEFWI